MKRREFLTSLGLGTAAALCHSTVSQAAKPAPSSKPNVLYILADDMGYSDARCYGGEIDTPNLDALAAHGVRFTQHYSTGRCWPSRSCLLTGYYANHIRRDALPRVKWAYASRRPPWAPLLPELIKEQGYQSYHSGKWHVDGTPVGGGFARSWGRKKFGCDDDRFFASTQWEEDGIKAPVQPGESYYSTIAIADHAIQCLKLHEKHHAQAPFFQYVAFYSPHFPLHALQKDIDKYRSTYTEGWDVIRARRLERMKKMGLVNCALSDRQEKIKPSWNLKPEALKASIGPGEAPYAVAWDTLTDAQKAFQATKMAIHAAMIHRMDSEVGRIIAQLKAMGAYENTLILFGSDNGASAEQIIRGDQHDKSAPLGSAQSYVCLGPGWSTAANTPFRLHKHWNHEGGISSPLIAHWPKGISARGELRHDASHFIDVLPTVVELAGATLPETCEDRKVPPRPGVSLLPAFARDGALKERTLWWCHGGNQAIRRGDWKLSMRSGNKKAWELYDLSSDRCEMEDLSSKHPEKVRQLAQAWQDHVERFKADLLAWPGAPPEGRAPRRNKK